MVKVITYGTYDMLHYGHIRLLERAKELGDYLIVGVTSDDFDKSRGKINVVQTLAERIEAVKSTGLADEIVIEEYEGQKIDDIQRLRIDIFTVGSDWVGKFDYLNNYCRVVYLERTDGVSSSGIRNEHFTRLGLIGESNYLNKVYEECKYVNGIEVRAIFSNTVSSMSEDLIRGTVRYDSLAELCENVDAVYVITNPKEHYDVIKAALIKGKHVMYESPLTDNLEQAIELYEIARNNSCILQECIKTAYSTAFSRMLLLLKSGKIGRVVSVDATCTSLNVALDRPGWSSIFTWGPASMLPIFEILGVEYRQKRIVSFGSSLDPEHDSMIKIDFEFDNAVASLKVGNGIKSEGELIISGTKGYVYVPAPWWKLDYFELRFENPVDNKRYFYQLEGEGIRYELVAFIQAIKTQRPAKYISSEITKGIVKVVEDYIQQLDTHTIVMD